MKGFLYTILAIIILAVIIIVLLGRDGSTPMENGSPGANTNITETETPNATSTDSNATSTPSDNSGQVDNDTSVEVDVVVDLTGENFAFSQEEITVQKGDRVRINFTSTGGFHDWVVDAFNASTDRVQEGGSTSVEFVANEAGEFEYYCSVGNHRQLGMIGTLVVEE